MEIQYWGARRLPRDSGCVLRLWYAPKAGGWAEEHTHPEPSYHRRYIADRFSSRYLYIACVRYISG